MADDFHPTGPARHVGGFASEASCSSRPCFKATCELTSTSFSSEHCAFSLRPASTCEPVGCLGWRQTDSCEAMGERQPKLDKSCAAKVDAVTSGFCECAGNVSYPFGCDVGRSRPDFTCADICNGGPHNPTTPPLLASSVALGPVMQEVRLQVSAEHKTRIRLWVSADQAVGGRIEIAHRIGCDNAASSHLLELHCTSRPTNEPSGPRADPACLRGTLLSPDPTRPDPTHPDPTCTNPTRTDPTHAHPTRIDPAHTDPAHTDPTGTDPTCSGCSSRSRRSSRGLRWQTSSERHSSRRITDTK